MTTALGLVKKLIPRQLLNFCISMIWNSQGIYKMDKKHPEMSCTDAKLNLCYIVFFHVIYKRAK